MLKKEIINSENAAAKIKSGMTVMVGGFMCVGTPERILNSLAESDVNDLTIICNDAGLPGRGVGKLIANGKVKKLIASHIGLNRIAGEKMSSGEMEIELVPQGTLVERIRSGGAGLGGVLTKTGLNTIVEEGKQKIEVEGEVYLVESPLRADVSLIKSSISDVYGNSSYNKTTNNFNMQMATAGELVLVEADMVVEADTLPAAMFSTPSIFVDYIVE